MENLICVGADYRKKKANIEREIRGGGAGVGPESNWGIRSRERGRVLKCFRKGGGKGLK